MSEFPQPLNLTTLLYMAVASILAALGGWLKGRQKERAEVRKTDAETRQILTTTEISQTGITLETLREIQAVILKAEQRREEWLLREEQMRTQIVFWRNKAEELDGELIDSRQANGLLEARYKNKSDSLDKAMALLSLHKISYAETDHPKN